MTLSWRGLRNGPIELPNPWITLFPGLLTISDLQASNLYARQRFLLWQDEDAPFRSSVDLQYTDSFPVYYADSLGALAECTTTELSIGTGSRRPGRSCMFDE